MKTIAIIPAGGKGIRGGTAAPKQYLKFNDKELIVYTLDIFQQNEMIDEIIISAEGSYINFLNDLKEKYNLSAFILSFLPFVRTEGFLILIIFMLAFIIYKQYKSTPFLFIGFILISIAGWPFNENPLWLINKMPYTGASEIYGSGELFHYVSAMPRILGVPLLILFVLGILSLFSNLKKSRKIESTA